MALERVLGAADGAWLVAGNMIGAGIFITPGLVASHLPGAAWPLAAWLLGGALALAGAAVYGELGTRIPRAGGDFQYLTRAFGPLWGFLVGWAAFTLSFSGAAAAMARVVFAYLASAFPSLEQLPVSPATIGAPLLLLALTFANTAGARIAGRATVILTAVPLAILVVLFGAGLLAGGAAPAWPEEPLAAPRAAWPLALGAAMVPVYFTFSGWNAAAYVAGEVRDPGRNLARALLWGTASVTLVYLLVNLTLIAVLPGEELAGSTRSAALAASRLLGPGGERALSLAIAVAVTGSANVTLMAGARIYYAMASGGLAPVALSRTNRRGVPGAALWAGGVWAALLSAAARVGDLVGWATLAILLLSSLTAASLFVLRRREPQRAPFSCPGYPVTPALYLAASLAVALSSGVREPRSALLGLALLAAGIPVYAFFRRRASRPKTP
jgi:APA family basic amino acid/polyamine antiporter